MTDPETLDPIADAVDSANGAGTIHSINIEQEMRAAYLDYAMSVIVRRALPDAQDGLKPVQRRILYAMHDMGMRPGSPYRKSARIVGEVLGKYHPHGDTAVYDAMARMAQDFSLRYPLVDGQGNFGSVDGDSPAAMRYTEARMARIAETLLRDIDMDTVDWAPNFDESLEEPLVLPAILPNLLINGASGIAVGMATNIPPHHLGEIADAVAHTIDNWHRLDEIDVEELMQFVKGPDFPTGGIILGQDGIRSAYATGKGHIRLQAVAEISEMPGGRFRIIISEIPYQLNKSNLMERIAELARSGRLDQISDLRDESDRTGMRIVIELKRGAAPRKTLNRLFKFTPLQSTFAINMLALVNGEPRLLSLKRALTIYVEHRQEVIIRRTRYELRKARERAHILEGYLIALEFIDEVIDTIRQSESADAARLALMERFGLSEIQAQAILDLQLRRLAALEQQRIQDDYDEVKGRIDYLEDLLVSPHKILALIKEDILALKQRYNDERRSQISLQAIGDMSEEDLIPNQPMLITITQNGYVKSTDSQQFRAQGRGGRGIRGMATRHEDEIAHLYYAHTHDHVLFFTNMGRVYTDRVWNLPEASRTSRGLPLVNVLDLGPDEHVTSLVVVGDFDDAKYISLLTIRGRIKRLDLQQFAHIRSSGIIAMNLGPDDQLGWARLSTGDDDLIIVTAGGRALRFVETQVRPMGRTAAGVMAIRLREGDEVTGFDVVRPECDLLIVSAHGYGKRTPLAQYPVKSRYTQGVLATDRTRLDETGPLVSGRVVHPADQISLITSSGIAIRMEVSDVSQMGRATRGVRMVNLDKGDIVSACARIRHEATGESDQDEDLAESPAPGKE
ncbi:MAG: DNA gyrase subunit A [Chloroflexota bacterium]|nr:DNA gyrase subunit A [Chloroflexota bacterium]